MFDTTKYDRNDTDAVLINKIDVHYICIGFIKPLIGKQIK